MSRKVLLIKKKVFAVHVSNLRLFLFLARAAFVCILPISNVLLPRTHECTITCRLLRWVLSPVSVIAWVEVGALESEQSRARCIAVLLSSPEKQSALPLLLLPQPAFASSFSVNWLSSSACCLHPDPRPFSPLFSLLCPHGLSVSSWYCVPALHQKSLASHQ